MNRIQLIKAVPMVFAILVLVAWGCGSGPSSESLGEKPVEIDEHGDEHGEEAVVRLGGATLDRLGIQLAVAGPGDLEVTAELPGEVQVNGDRMAHVGPRVGGTARTVLVSLGDTVRKGQLLAVLESRDLADTKASYLAAGERMSLAEATFRREERLWREKVSSEQDYLEASNGLAEARIEVRTAEQKLHALGFGEDELRKLTEEPDTGYTSYRITAPFDGEVIDRHITIGETISAEASVFTVADLSTVWIDLRVYQKDLAHVERGQQVHVKPASNGIEGVGTIEFLQPLLGEETRTALARFTMPNPERRWKPGMFVTATVIIDASQVDFRVPRTALIRMENGDEVIFVQTDEGFEPRLVTLGRRARDHMEVISGLEPGESYVVEGGFSLKAELGKDAFGDGHGH